MQQALEEPTVKKSYLNLKVPPRFWAMLTVLSQEDLRTRPNTILTLIQQEYLRRHPDGLPVETGSTSMQVEPDLHRG